MEKTISINLGGTLFKVDEGAYMLLRNYLQNLDLKFRNTPGGNETLEDIESRIAEIFQSQKGLAGVISKENVEAMISIIGRPEDFGQSENEGAAYQHTAQQRKRMFRNLDDKIIGGVCGGIGAYLDTDPVWFRILFVVSALMFGFGFFVYLALWIALPPAVTESQKKEMFGIAYNSTEDQGRGQIPSYTTTSKVGNAFNEVFRAMGRVLFIIVRIFLIVLGILLVLTGFLAILSFVMVFIFKFPGAFSTDAAGINLSYVPDFLNYIVTPGIVPWVKALIVLIVSLPLLAIIYGGIRMIFWFKARDGFVWLIGLIIWVLSVAALSIIMLNEGISHVETAKSISENYFKTVPDTLYIKSGQKISDLKYDNEISIPDEEYNIYISDEKKEVYLRTYLDISVSEEHSAKLDVARHSAGRSKSDATEKADRLLYNFQVSGDTLFIDEFFAIPPDTKWSFDEVRLNLYIPEGTIVYMDKITESQFHSPDDDFVTDPKNRFWLMTKDGLDYMEPNQRTIE